MAVMITSCGNNLITILHQLRHPDGATKIQCISSLFMDHSSNYFVVLCVHHYVTELPNQVLCMVDDFCPFL